MSWTKRQFIMQAFDEIGLSGYVFDLQAEQLQNALRKLDSMMATWNAKGIRLGYPMPSTPENSDLDTETNVPDAANEAIFLNLAVRLGPSFGKVVSIDTKVEAKRSFDALLSRFIRIKEFKFPQTLPSGAGNRTIYQEYIQPDTQEILNGPDSELEF